MMLYSLSATERVCCNVVVIADTGTCMRAHTRIHTYTCTRVCVQGVTTTRSEARRAVKRCLLESWRSHSAPTILVGHGLSNDLRSLRLDYQPCIDTALIFSFQ